MNMNNYKFSKNSREQLDTVDADLQMVFELALQRSAIDFGISEGHRNVERQQKKFAQGRTEPGPIVTHVDGVETKSRHNYKPSKAVDVYAWVNGAVSYAEKDLCYIAGVVQSCAQELAYNGEISSKVTWGGNWNNDGEIVTGQSFKDLPHYQISIL